MRALNWEDWERMEAAERGVVIGIDDWDLVVAYGRLMLRGWVQEKGLERQGADGTEVWGLALSITESGRVALATRQEKVRTAWARRLSY